MLKIGILIGIYSYIIFLMGILSVLYFGTVIVITILFGVYILSDKKIINALHYSYKSLLNAKWSEKFLLVILLAASTVNLIGALGPELGFDALWYHLTIPKIFITEYRVFYIEGNLFYYSLLPKLTEMLYASALLLGNEVYAKLIHYLFGIASCYVLFKASREFTSVRNALIVVIIFYSNLVISWLSITAYVDLARTFFEISAFYYFIKFSKDQKKSNLMSSAILVGLAICVKVVSIISIPIYLLLILFVSNVKWGKKLSYQLLFTSLALLVALPWFVYSYLHTNNPVFPFFSTHSPKNWGLDSASMVLLYQNVKNVFIFAADPLTPLYAMILPVGLLQIRKIIKHSLLIFYCAIALLLWYITTFGSLWHATGESGSTRLLSPYLPALSILCMIIISSLRQKLRIFSMVIIIVVALVTIAYRSVANMKYIPYILGNTSKQEFLMTHLNFDFGDFYDENLTIKKMVGEQAVLLLNMHNLFYVDFPFTLSEFNNDKKYKYILVQKGELPQKNLNATLIYENPKTHVKLYKL